MLSKIAIFSEPRISAEQYFINIFFTMFHLRATHVPPPPKPLPQYSAHSDTQSAHPGTKKERTDIRFPPFSGHNRQLILHIVIIVGAHISGLVRQLIGTLYLIIAVIVVVGGAVVGRIVYFDVYLD